MVKEGDANTRYFHSSLLDKRSQLTIRRIKSLNGNYIKGDDNIGTAVVDFFKSLLAEPSLVNNLAATELLNLILHL